MSQMQFGKLHNYSSAKNTELEKVFPESDNKYLCVWTSLFWGELTVLSAIPHPAGLQMGSHTKKFDVIIIVSPFISAHD